MGQANARNRLMLALLALLAPATCLWSCRGGPTETALPTLERSMKGYELYSWHERSGWCYALVVGTNRIKTHDEIAASEPRIQGLEELRDQLARLPEGEQVFWSAGRVPGTILPPAGTVDEVRKFCDQNGIGLQVWETGW